MPQPASKIFLAQLRKEAVGLAARFEQTDLANEKQGTNATMLKAMAGLLPGDQSQDFYLGVMWALNYAVDLLDQAKKRNTIVVPGRAPVDIVNKMFYAYAHMTGLAAVRASESKKGKKC